MIYKMQLDDQAIFHGYHAVADFGQPLIVGHDDKRLIEIIAERDKELMQ